MPTRMVRVKYIFTALCWLLYALAGQSNGVYANSITDEATSGPTTAPMSDSNDHAPVFRSSTLPRTIYLSELSSVNTALYDIYASDDDVGVNKKVYFDLDGGNVGAIFQIISVPSEVSDSLGVIQLNAPLDYESGPIVYSLKIRAYNKDAANSLDSSYHTTSTLTIKVTDANEPPVFVNTPYNATVSEGDNTEDVVPINLAVIAADYDFNASQSVSYLLNDPQGWFQIDATTGIVSRIAKVDRESAAVQNGVYIVKVVAIDNYDHGAPASASADVTITITDVNDNPPSPYWGSVGPAVSICNEPANDTVYTLSAADPDTSANGPPFAYRLADSVDSSKWGIAEVDFETARVFSKFEDYGLCGSSQEVLLPFTIADNGSPVQTGTSTLTVTVFDCREVKTCSGVTPASFPAIVMIAAIAFRRMLESDS